MSDGNKRFRKPRLWSNRELRALAPLFDGKVVNVSAGDDGDKEGHKYSEYFTNCSSYSTTNYPGDCVRGLGSVANDIAVDLEGIIPSELQLKFQVALCHTVLEHIFDIRTAFRNLCLLSEDLLIVIVPFCQVQHENEGYLDYWRFTPTCLRRLAEAESFKVIYESASDERNSSIYVLAVMSRHPERWSSRLKQNTELKGIGDWIGRGSILSEVGTKAFKRLMSKASHS